jgi:RNA polymerase sigma-70 factor (ECF subfamily)
MKKIIPKLFKDLLVSINKLSNEELMTELVNGNAEAFEVLFNRYKDPIFSYILNMTFHESVASELTQDVFFKVFNKSSSFNSNHKFTTWLWTIARNTSIDYLKNKDATRFTKDIKTKNLDETNNMDSIESNLKSSETLLIESMSGNQIRQAMKALKDSHQEVLSLRIVNEFSYEEIANIMNISLASVKSLLHRAKENLLKELSRGEDSHE